MLTRWSAFISLKLCIPTDLILFHVVGSSITSESENDFVASDLPSATRSNQGFIINQGFTIDVVDEIADAIDNSDFGKFTKFT